MIQPPADSLRRVVRQVLSSPAYQWRDESDLTTAFRRWKRALLAWLDDLAGHHPLAYRLLLWGLVAALVAIALHAIWVLIRTTRARPPTEREAVATGTAVVRNARWWATEVDRLLGLGRYAAAMQAQFVVLALELDARNLIRFHPSKTPLEYLVELPNASSQRADFAGLVGDLYRYAYAGDRCGPSEFEAWRSRARLDRYAPDN